jgi:dihydroneopterin aldolase
MINLELELDLAPAARSNRIEDTIDYVAVSLIVRTLAQSKEFLLVESLAHEITETLFKHFNKLEGILIEINKTIVNAEQFTGNPSIKIYRSRA